MACSSSTQRLMATHTTPAHIAPVHAGVDVPVDAARLEARAHTRLVKRQTNAKRRIFRAIIYEVMTACGLTDQSERVVSAIWRRCLCHKCLDLDLTASAETATTNLRTRLIEWVNANRDKLPVEGRVDVIARPTIPIAIPRVQAVAIAHAAPAQVVNRTLRAVAHVRPGLAMAREDMDGMLHRVRAAAFNTMVLAHAVHPPTMTRILPHPDDLDDVFEMDDVEAIERMFEARGIGESGPTCPVCMEPKRKWTRFSTDCDHSLCIECAEDWMKANILASGAKCPGCVADGGPHRPATGVAKIHRFADPIVMFGKDLTKAHDRVTFASMQIPHLQGELDALTLDNDLRAPEDRPPQPLAPTKSSDMISTSSAKPDRVSQSKTIGRCPSCGTVSSGGINCLRRCHNPRCATEYCIECDTVIIGCNEEQKKKHTSGACKVIAEETKKIFSGEGFAPCETCGTQLYHARGHGCHHVKCPTCNHEQCHSCGKEYIRGSATCRCPIFCTNTFKCKCAQICPECETSRCVHCSGMCIACIRRDKKKSSIGSVTTFVL